MLELRPWAETDFPLLKALLGDPEMTRFLGGPRSDEELKNRHERYLNIVRANDAKARTFAVVLVQNNEPVGWTGYWESKWREQLAYETGWARIPIVKYLPFPQCRTKRRMRSAVSLNSRS
jgi:RimJ/RimL family protein N-acetyltransferase